MTAAVARRSTPTPATTVPQSPPADENHVALDEAARRWLAEGDTAENVAAYAAALRDLLRTASS